MNPPNDPKVKTKIPEVFPADPVTKSSIIPKDLINSLKNTYQHLQLWFQALPAWGQIGLVIGGAVVALNVLKTVMQLISLSITLAILGVIIYFGYKILIAPNDPNQIKK
jgi:hypothetical protein